MKGMKLPTRPAPTVEDARLRKNINQSFCEKKKAPPPRPPPPKFNKTISQSAWNLHQEPTVSLIEWSPPSSPKSKHHPFSGSISSSFSSSTSSLASSKKSLEYESVPLNVNPWNTNVPFPFPTYGLQAKTNAQPPAKSVPTIIRAQPSKKGKVDYSAPMPKGPPPSPPKVVEDAVAPFGIALYDYKATQGDDLQLHVNDIVYLIRKVNDEWLYGRVDDREGMFPANFVDIHIPLVDDNMATALYEFRPQMQGDLQLKPGQKIKIISRISAEWLYGESAGVQGQFPSNFVDKIPPHI